jgi:adenosylmethionine-8-amino-7-oxononanoate aminotransferase
VVVADDARRFTIGSALTTPDLISNGLAAALTDPAGALRLTCAAVLGRIDILASSYSPLSATALGAERYADLERGAQAISTFAHAGSYAAHPVGTAAALKTLEIIERDGLVPHAARMGERLARGLHARTGHPLVAEVRALGLGGRLDLLKRDADDRRLANDDEAHAVCMCVYDALCESGVTTPPTGDCLILVPPLIG